MGLDQYVWTTTEKPENPVDFEFSTDASLPVLGDEDVFRDDPVFGSLFNTKPGAPIKALAYFRKHPDLHGFIQELYEAKGGNDLYMGSFSGPVVLDKEDIDRIEEATQEKTLPKTSGFFFGQSGWTNHDEQTLEMCRRARKAIEEGLTVVYDSSW